MHHQGVLNNDSKSQPRTRYKREIKGLAFRWQAWKSGDCDNTESKMGQKGVQQTLELVAVVFGVHRLGLDRSGDWISSVKIQQLLWSSLQPLRTVGIWGCQALHVLVILALGLQAESISFKISTLYYLKNKRKLCGIAFESQLFGSLVDLNKCVS